ncbi:DUF4184 family protein [Kribbella ginsengisoli]|uniref:DUF4184 family protein n=1 Tax=Kribbella ginsengisoli TaxID=363865 RepID=A0ABP6YJ26_9ACTN
MPFTLAHPAAVLPLLRHPFVPAALVAGSMAPDVPYFLRAAGITSTTAGDWYEPLLNATHTHSLTGLPIDLLYAVALVLAYWLIRAPITALLPPGLALPQPTSKPRPAPATSSSNHGRGRAGPQYIGWLVASALIGVGTHLLWDAFTDADLLPAQRLLQYASTAFGLVVVTWYLWRHRTQLRTTEDRTHHLTPAVRHLVLALLIAAPLLGAAVLAHRDYTDYQTDSAAWTAIAEGVLTGAVKRAGAALAIALLLYTAAWQAIRPLQKKSPQH